MKATFEVVHVDGRTKEVSVPVDANLKGLARAVAANRTVLRTLSGGWIGCRLLDYVEDAS